MIRTICWFIAGAVVAGTITALVLQGRPGQASNPVAATAAAGSAVPTAAPLIRAPDSFAASLSIHERLEGLNSVTDLESRISEVAARTATSAVGAELEVLLLRLAELDPDRAAGLAQRLALDAGLLARIFKVWAGANPDAALAELGSMPATMTQRAVALGLLDVFGVDNAGIERVAAIFSPDAANNFRVDAFGKLAERDVVAALAALDADTIPAAVRTIAQQRIATVMARIDPLAAFNQARSVSPTFFRRRYVNALIDTWAKIDPGATLDFLETAELPELELGPMSFRALAASSPERLLAVAEQLSPATRTYAQQAVVWALTALDPVAAYQRVSSLPPSGDIDQLVASIANRYTRQNADAALAWALSLEPRSPLVLNRVIATIAETDPVRATNALIAQITDPVAANSIELPSIVSLLSEPLGAGAPALSQVADTLAANRDPRVRMQLDQLLQIWPQVDVAGALEWALRRPSDLTRNAASSMAQQLGSSDPQLAQQTLQQLPAALRGAWLVGAASGMARNDFDSTLAWIERYRGDPSYAEAVQAASFGGVDQQPEAVARLVDSRPELSAQLAPIVARSWGASDPAAAERWVLGRAQGPERDQAIQALLQGTANAGTFNTDLLARLSSDAAREQAVLLSVLQLAGSNPALGRQLIDEHIDNPELRAEAERRLEAGGSANALLLQQLLQR